MSDQEWDGRVRDMLNCCERVLMHTAGLDREGVFETSVVLDATLWNITIIGEAASHVPDAIQGAHTEIPWRMIIDARNRIIHGYGSLDEDVLWDIIANDIPALMPQLRALLDEAEAD